MIYSCPLFTLAIITFGYQAVRKKLQKMSVILIAKECPMSVICEVKIPHRVPAIFLQYIWGSQLIDYADQQPTAVQRDRL